jgi:hydroxymethylpyrimidine pyrophosphatase-like HAD family hydrolase
MGGHTAQDVAGLVDAFDELSPQEEEKQSEFKRSYYVAAGADLRGLVRRVKRRLGAAGISANLVHSVDPKSKVGLLDVLPRNVAKDFALVYLRRKLKLSSSHLVYAGDSGNDLLAFASGVNAVVVANTPPAVREVLHSLARKKGFSDRIYFARRPCVEGVIEGCLHFGVFRAR